MILITGASRGIGKYLLEEFVSQNKIVYGTYKSTKPSDELKDCYSKVNIEDILSVQNWLDSIKNKEKIVLINCAGISYNKFGHKSDIKKWKKVIDVNLTGTFNVIRTILPYMRDDGYGRIINFSSIVAQTGVMGASAYAASKSGLWGLSKTLAKENGSKGITINNLNLGYFDLGIISEVPEHYKKKLKKIIPSSKFGSPNEILKAVNYLIESEYINGTSLDINGGLY